MRRGKKIQVSQEETLRFMVSAQWSQQYFRTKNMLNPLKVCRAGSRGHFSRHYLTRQPAMFTCDTKTRFARNHAKFKDNENPFHEVASHFYSKYVVRFQWFTWCFISGKFNCHQSLFCRVCKVNIFFFSPSPCGSFNIIYPGAWKESDNFP